MILSELFEKYTDEEILADLKKLYPKSDIESYLFALSEIRNIKPKEKCRTYDNQCKFCT